MQAPAISSGDTAWVLISTALVLFMVPGLAFFYGGLVRSKSALNTMLMSLGALAIVTVQWVLVGYSVAFGPGSTWIGGLSFFGFLPFAAIIMGCVHAPPSPISSKTSPPPLARHHDIPRPFATPRATP